MLKLLAKLSIIAYFGLFILLAAGTGYLRLKQAEPPRQPIAFPHTVHAGDLALPCTFCHRHVEDSPRAGVPEVEVCMSCHRTVAVERPEIQKLHRYWETREPIRWPQVNQVPAFVHFPHKRHVRAGVECAVCHGAVAEMTGMQRVRSLQMGWCLSCHRARRASTDCAACHI